MEEGISYVWSCQVVAEDREPKAAPKAHCKKVDFDPACHRLLPYTEGKACRLDDGEAQVSSCCQQVLVTCWAHNCCKEHNEEWTHHTLSPCSKLSIGSNM